MAPLSQGHETGVPVIDAGNEGLRFLLARMFQPGVECRRGDSGHGDCDYSRCTRISALMRYVERNFAHQEEVMAESGYPDTGRHRDDHASLLDRLGVMLHAQVCADKDAAKVHDLVSHWAVEHMLACDRPLGRWALTRRVLEPKR
jgi:hemerythrin-like metal-binding protein